MNKASLDEMREEALFRLGLLELPEKLLRELRSEFRLKVTYFSGEVGDVEKIHEKALNMLRDIRGEEVFPFYITESWHGTDLVSVLYVEEDKDGWDEERYIAREGHHRAFGYNPSCAERSGFGDGVFSIEDGVLWRVE